MQSLSMRRSVTALLVLVALVAGCAPKIVRPPDTPAPIVSPAPQAPGQFPGSGEINEQTLQVIQAELKPVYFDYDSFSLSTEGRTALQQNAEVLRRASRLTVVAEGHCDERGTAEYNLALGERRAAAVVDYLVALGIPQQQLSTVSFGSELPVEPAHNDAAWSKNRRVQMRATR
jgi:peptidoglycan-associated lipoprotein